MNPLSRYVLAQHLGPFLFGCSLIVFVLVIDVVLQMMDRVLSRGLSFFAAGQLFFYNLGWIIALAVPMAVLVAVLMAFGRLSADSEILALKSSGISLFQVMKPVLAAAAVLTALMVLFNDRVLPDWNHKARSIQADLKRRKAALVLKQKEGIFIRDLGGYSLLVRRVDEAENRLYGVTLVCGGRNGPPQTLHAEAAEVQIFDDGGYMRLTLFDGEFHRIDGDDPRQFVEGRFERQVIHVTDRDRAARGYSSSSSYRSDREMDIGAMMAAVADYRAGQARETAAMDSAVQAFLDTVAARYAATPAGDEAGAEQELSELPLSAQAEKTAKQLYRQTRLNQNRERRANAYLVEIHKKFSIAAACIVFVLVGAPAGALVRTRGAATAVVLSLVFFFVYWMFLIGGEGLADRGYVSPGLAMWAPNLCFGGSGILLLRVVALDQPTGGRLGRRLLTALAYYRPGARAR